MANVRTYSSKTRVGNWYEDCQLEEDTIKEFLARKDRGELLTQRVANVTGQTAEASCSSLSVASDGFLRFGDVIQLQNPGADPLLVRCGRAEERQPAALSVTPLNLAADEMGCSGSRDVTSSGRNMFRVTSCDGTPDSERVQFGQSFQLTTSGDCPLFLVSDSVSFGRAAKKSRNQEVSMSAQNSFMTHWKAEMFSPLYRFEFEGAPIPVNEKLIIKHVKTNEALALETKFMIATLFGLEYEVSCHTYIDDHKAECDSNHWLFATQRMPGACKKMDDESNTQE